MQPIKLPPNSGQILMCDYRGFIEPEMVKKRPVIVISPRARNGYNLVHVVPLSTTEPRHLHYYHIPIMLPPHLIGIDDLQQQCWAKCDLINSVSFSRLQLIKLGRDISGKRQYSSYCVNREILISIRKAAAKVMGLVVDLG